jgi:ABC-2 type transport system ATP-binding protein
MPVSPPCVSVRGLVKHYGPFAAVRGVSFDVAPGEIFGLLGPNGAGKTSTLECLLGLRQPDAGTIAIDGIDARAEPARARARIGAQIQPGLLQATITPREALQFFAAFHRSPASVGELLARFGLAERIDARFDTLSTGQKQRLSVALAFVNQPSLLVLDEPTAGLDPQARRELHRVLEEERAAGHTVLLSTHNLEEAHRLCDRIAILHRGEIVTVARPDELTAQSRAAPHLTVRTARPLTSAEVARLPGVERTEPFGAGWRLFTREINRTTVALTKSLESGSNELRELQIHQPSLEDVFIELTGETWTAPAEEAP